MLEEVDYVLISYYEDDNFYTAADGGRFPIRPDENRWAQIFRRLKTSFTARTKFGFGEVCPQCYYRQSDRNCQRVLDIHGNAAEKSANNCTPQNPKDWEVRRCVCCLKAQKNYIERYYLEWDTQIRRALETTDAALGRNYVGGYFYWQYNDDVINKSVYADDTDIDRQIRRKLREEAVAAQSFLTDAYQRW